MSKHNKVLHPNEQHGYVFGVFPEITKYGLNFPMGPIYLLNGEHRGKNRGFGLEHIVAEHGHQLRNQFKNLECVNTMAIHYVADLLSAGMPIYCEFDGLPSASVKHSYSAHKSTVVNSAKGSVVLELRLDGQNQHFYAVITAFNRRQGKGTEIGRLPRL